MEANLPGRRKLLLSATITVIVAVGISSGRSFAQGGAQGSNYNYSDGYKYFNQNTIDTTSGFPADATILVATQNFYAQVPAGYMGVKPMMFESSGVLCRAGNWTYNGTPLIGFSVGVSPGCGAGPIYYSQGASRAWNGVNYDTYPSWPSPNENS